MMQKSYGENKNIVVTQGQIGLDWRSLMVVGPRKGFTQCLKHRSLEYMGWGRDRGERDWEGGRDQEGER